MKDYIVQLYFRNSLHVGASNSIAGVDDVQDFIHSDTLWAAIANNWALLGQVGGIGFNEFLESYKTGNPLFTLSSAFPLTDNGTRYWLPKPLSAPYAFSINNKRRKSNQLSYGKEMKGLRFISLRAFRDWSRFENYDLSMLTLDTVNIGRSVRPKSMIDRVAMRSNLYHSGLTYFDDRKDRDRSGLYFILRIIDDETAPIVKSAIEELLAVMSDISGLGGNICSGCGQFAEKPKIIEVSEAIGGDNELWADVLTDSFEGANACCLLSLASKEPADFKDGVDSDGYLLVLRKGWTGSMTSDVQAKRQTVFMFGEGSVFLSKIEGGLVDITPKDTDVPYWKNRHRVYRYGYVLSVPMKIDIEK